MKKLMMIVLVLLFSIPTFAQQDTTKKAEKHKTMKKKGHRESKTDTMKTDTTTRDTTKKNALVFHSKAWLKNAPII